MKVAVACSGGRDSMALLYAAVRSAAALDQEAAGAPSGRLPLQVWALHVHHGLSPHADAWAAHVADTCAQWRARGWPVSARVMHVDVPATSTEGLEAAARRARHAALHAMCDALGIDLLLLAHHRRDQAETVLLQALRGASAAGLAGMPRQQVRAGVVWARPWLDRPREQVEAYVRMHGLRHIEDESNADPRHARNRLRLGVWPAVLAAFPHAEEALCVTGQRAADAMQALDAWTEERLPPAGEPAWPLGGWLEWAVAERRETLRHWYHGQAGHGLRGSWVQRLADELPQLVRARRNAHWPALGLALYRGVLSYALPAAPVATPAPAAQDATDGMLCEGWWRFPDAPGWYEVQAAVEGGVSVQVLAALRPRARQGGEQWQAGPGRPPRALKKQFQAAGVPAWARAGAPLWFGDELAFVPGLGVDARWRAPAGEPQWAITWQPAAPAEVAPLF